MKKKSKSLYFILFASMAVSVCYAFFTTQRVSLIPRTVLFGNPSKLRPSLSPDGTQLAYSAPFNGVLNIWIKTVGKDDDRILTQDTKRGIYNFSWAASGKQLLYLQDNDGDENYQLFAIDSITGETKNYTLFPGIKAHIIAIDKDYPHEILIEMNKDNPKFFDVYHLDLITEKLTLITKNSGTFTRWIVGSHLQILGALQTNADGSQDLFVRDNNEDQWRKLLTVDFEDTLEDELYSGILGFNKNDTLLYLNTSLGTNTRSLQSVTIKTGERKIIAQDQEFDIDRVIFNVVTDEPDIVCWDKERSDYKLLNPLLKDDFDHIRSIADGDLCVMGQSYDGKKWIVGFMFDNKSFQYYLYDFTTKEVTFLFDYHPELNHYKLAPMEPISFIARDGLKIYGYLTCPLGVERKNLPLIIYVHGGPFARDSWEYHSVVQWFANRGCACLQINYRGSTGYGKAFLVAGNGEWGGKMHDDLIDGVDWAVDQGIAYPKRIAIFGGSYGGYAALIGATFTPDVFCCAVDYCGSSNLMTVLDTLPPYWNLSQWEKRIGKRSDEEFLKSRSPLFKVDSIKIPILVAHGGNDVRVKQSESEQIVEAMKKKGIPHEYLLFPDEGHGFARPENRLIFYAAVEKFLAKYLGCRYEV